MSLTELYISNNSKDGYHDGTGGDLLSLVHSVVWFCPSFGTGVYPWRIHHPGLTRYSIYLDTYPILYDCTCIVQWWEENNYSEECLAFKHML